jgi:hypothetical protein
MQKKSGRQVLKKPPIDISMRTMKNWRKNIWPSELKQVIKAVLSNGDMTLKDLADVVKKTAKINIHHAAMAAILQTTDGVFVKCQIFSEVSKKMVNVYSIGFQNRKDGIL